MYIYVFIYVYILYIYFRISSNLNVPPYYFYEGNSFAIHYQDTTRRTLNFNFELTFLYFIKSCAIMKFSPKCIFKHFSSTHLVGLIWNRMKESYL